MKRHLFAIAAVLVAMPLSLRAQAPAGSTGQCKDGSYTSAANKSGACRGHKGVQTWYSATPAAGAVKASSGAKATSTAPAAKPAAPAAAATPAAPAMKPAAPAPAMAPAMAPAAKPASAAPAMAVAPVAKAAPAAKPASATKTGSPKQPAPGGGPGMVWVNTSSKVYHCPGSDDYGTTKAGKYMSEADAKASGAHAAYNKPCSAK